MHDSDFGTCATRNPFLPEPSWCLGDTQLQFTSPSKTPAPLLLPPPEIARLVKKRFYFNHS
jgi:hypothetical protein